MTKQVKHIRRHRKGPKKGRAYGAGSRKNAPTKKIRRPSPSRINALPRSGLETPFSKLKRKLQFFETPPVVAKLLIKHAKILPGQRVLEPSAGMGALAAFIPTHAKLEVAEISPMNRAVLKEEGFKIIAFDFFKIPNKPIYDRIVANPPFSKHQDQEHIYKMYNLLKPNGRLVSLSGPGWTFRSLKRDVAFRKWLRDKGAKLVYVPRNLFKESGTSIDSILIIIDKNARPLKKNFDFNEWQRNQREIFYPSPKEEKIDLNKTWQEVEEAHKESLKHHRKMRKIMNELGVTPRT